MWWASVGMQMSEIAQVGLEQWLELELVEGSWDNGWCP
jgi:hypothetical protein